MNAGAGSSGGVDLNATILHLKHPRGQPIDKVPVVADKKHGPSFFFRNVSHLAQTFFLKPCVPDRKDFVYNQNLRL